MTGVQPKFGNGNHITFSFNLGDVHLLEIYANGPGNNSSNYADVQVAGDDGSFVSVKSDMTNGNGWNTISSAPLDTRQIRVFSPSSGVKVNLRGLRINGRILVDTGVWDASQNWSDGFIPTSSTQPWPNPQTNAFDGNLTTLAFQNASSLSWSNPLGSGVTSIGSGVRVYPRESGGAGKTFTLNGGPTTSIAANGWTTINVGSESYFNSFTIGSGESYLAAIEVDGTILVDAGPTWNTSQTWSAEGKISGDTLYTSGNSNYRNIFDGSLSTSWTPTTNGSTPGGRQIFTFNNPISCTKLEVYFSRGTSSVDIQVNGIASEVPAGEPNRWHTIFDTPGSNLSSVSAEYIPGGSASIQAIRVDGAILVDKASFGANGFYLPFDPTNTGVIYSGSFTQSGTEVLVNGSLFNGNSGDGVRYEGEGSTDSGVMTLSTPITTSGEITVYYLGQGSDRTIQFNNESPQKFMTGSGGNVRSVTLPAPTSINYITFQDAAGQGASAIVSGFEANNAILIDHNSIGVDASGNKNNFHDQNFGIGNTSQVWSSGGDNSELRSGSSWENVSMVIILHSRHLLPLHISKLMQVPLSSFLLELVATS